MSRLGRFAVIGVLAAQAGAAVAADMPGTWPPPVPVAPHPLIENFGWYLRGDLGYGWGTLDSAQSSRTAVDPTDNSVSGAFVGGVGVGIKTRWLRTDLTVDYTGPLKYQGTIASSNDTTMKVQAVNTLLNGYLDLGTWYHATPYIGAGAGVAQLHSSDYTSTPSFTGDLSHTQWKFSWALMAGVGYAVAPNIMADIGYRYVNFGDVNSASDALGSVTLKNLAAHEVRVGFRWSFDDLPVR